MKLRSAVSIACLLFPALSFGSDIYKWTDENGQVHYGSTKQQAQNNDAQRIKLRGAAITESDYQNAVSRSARENALAEKKVKPNEALTTPPSNTPNSASDSPSTTDKKNRCEEEWRKYRESLSCVAPYKVVGGGTKEEAAQHCTIMSQPALCN